MKNEDGQQTSSRETKWGKISKTKHRRNDTDMRKILKVLQVHIIVAEGLTLRWGHIYIYSILFYSIPLACAECDNSLAVLRSFFHSSLSHTFSCHSSPPTILPSSLTSSCHLFHCLPLGLAASKFIYNTLLRILFSSILCTCPNQCDLCNLIVSVMVGF